MLFYIVCNKRSYDIFYIVYNTAIAALMGPLKNKLSNQKTIILLCGSNIDLETWFNLVK